MGVSEYIRRHIAVYGTVRFFKDEDAELGFILTLRDGTCHLVKADAIGETALRNWRKTLVAEGGDCTDLIREGELQMAMHIFPNYRAGDGFELYLLRHAVFNGEYRVPEMVADYFYPYALARLLGAPPYSPPPEGMIRPE